MSSNDYSEELKLNIRCDEDDSHVAVLYCTKCKTNLCQVCSDSIHALKSLSNHQIVRLTQKPEPPISCYLHPQEKAELVCKETSCDGVHKPICINCHIQGTHKDHSYKTLENEYDAIRINIDNCLDKIRKKRISCDKNLAEYEKCILTYSIANNEFMKSERDKIDKFYSDARTLTLKTFDDFAENRIETLKTLKNQYISDKTKLLELSSELQNIEKMEKMEVIKSGQNVENSMIHAETNLIDRTDLVPSNHYSIVYPNLESINIKIDLSKNVQQARESHQRIRAVYFTSFRYSASVMQRFMSTSRRNSAVEYGNNGMLYKWQSILHLSHRPNNNTVDLSQYKYIAVLHCWSENEEAGKKKLRELIEKNWWSCIIVAIDFENAQKNEGFARRILEISRTDQRVKIMKYFDEQEVFDALFQV